MRIIAYKGHGTYKTREHNWRQSLWLAKSTDFGFLYYYYYYFRFSLTILLVLSALHAVSIAFGITRTTLRFTSLSLSHTHILRVVRYKSPTYLMCMWAKGFLFFILILSWCCYIIHVYIRVYMPFSASNMHKNDTSIL